MLSANMTTFLEIVIDNLKEAVSTAIDKNVPRDRWPDVIVYVKYGFHEVAIKIKKWDPCQRVIKAMCSKFGLDDQKFALKDIESKTYIIERWPVSVLENRAVFLQEKPFGY